MVQRGEGFVRSLDKRFMTDVRQDQYLRVDT
jgi:hypothetical protein